MTRRAYNVELCHPQFYVDEVECLRGCPVDTDARGYIIAISSGDYREGYRIARAPNPFASICGKVCGAPCETTCRRGKVDAPLSIRAMKGFLTDRHGAETVPPAETLAASDAQGSVNAAPTGKRIAIVGAGVSGLTCAHDLARLGHECHVFDREETAGGLLVYGVPLYRLNRELVAREVAAIASMELVQLHLNTDVGKDISFAQLREDYDAVYLAPGLPTGKRIPLPGSDHPDVTDAMALLHDYCAGRGRDLSGRHVLVIGGGNVAMDAVRSSLRLNAATVTGVCLERDWDEAPADLEELEDADAEGVVMQMGWGPIEVVHEGERIAGLKVKKVLSVFDSDGRFAPQFDETQVRVIPCDMLVFSVGQTSETGFLTDIGAAHTRGIVQVDPTTKQTSVEGVFAGGDASSGPGLFIDCIKDASDAALAIDSYLTGMPLKEKLRVPTHRIIPNYRRPSEYLNLKRVRADVLSPEARCRTNDMIETVYDEAEAHWQAVRCLECHITPIFNGNQCIMCNGCVDVCPHFCLRMVDASLVAGDEARAVLAAEFGEPPVEMGKGSVMLFDRHSCIRCGLCARRCPTDAVIMERATFRIEYRETERTVKWSSD